MIYKRVPVDAANTAMHGFPPAVTAVQQFGVSNTATSSVITFNDNATQLEVTAGTAPLAIKWIATTDTTASVVAVGSSANFDHVIGTNVTRKFAIPQESQRVASIVGANIKNGLYRRIAWITAGANSSVYAAIY